MQKVSKEMSTAWDLNLFITVYRDNKINNLVSNQLTNL